ncbi:MAG: MFS transporter [Deltaproteobacteria bacterium]
MIQVISSSWALLLGLLLLMIGNGLQGPLLGIRGSLEGFSTFAISIVMSAYFAGFLAASRTVPQMIARVGHVRVFAALGSFISAVLILYPAFANPYVWTALRALIGFCFCGVYITAESWLNNAADNENRGKAMSLYLIAQMLGIVSAQGILAFGDPSGWLLFVIPSVLVSIAFAPILLSVSQAPSFAETKSMPLMRLIRVSPLSAMGVFLLGGVFAAQFGMSAVFGQLAGLSVKEISLFVAVIYSGGLLLQYPTGWLSDRMDRRKLIALLAAAGALSGVLGALGTASFPLILISGFLIGGISNPLYALLIAHANDFLDRSDMAAASGGLLFINGVGAIFGPVVTGWLLARTGPPGYFILIAVLMVLLAIYTVLRMQVRHLEPQVEKVPMTPVTAAPLDPIATP